MTISARSRRATRPRTLLLLAIPLLLALAAVAGVLFTRPHQPSKMALPLRHVGEIALPGDGSRFDYASLDPGRGLLFIAHLGASEVIEADVHSGRVLRTITGLPGVHGVLADDPGAHRLYVAAESGWVTILNNHNQHLTVTGRAYLAAGAHVVAVDPATHRTYYPVPHGPAGHPALMIYRPAM